MIEVVGLIAHVILAIAAVAAVVSVRRSARETMRHIATIRAVLVAHRYKTEGGQPEGDE